MLLRQVVCVLSSSMRVSGDTPTSPPVWVLSERLCVTTFITALTEALKAVRSTQAFNPTLAHKYEKVKYFKVIRTPEILEDHSRSMICWLKICSNFDGMI